MSKILYTITSLLLFLFLLTGTASAETKQIYIAVAAEDAEINAQISEIAARAPYFLFFDKNNNLVDTVKNQAAAVKGGAGPKAAAFLAEENVTLVIAGHFGNKMAAALTSSKIQTVERQGRAIDAVKEQNNAQK